MESKSADPGHRRRLHARNAKSASARTLKTLKTGQDSYQQIRQASNPKYSDEYCPHCDNHYVLEAVTPTPALQLEGEDARIDARMLKDNRVRNTPEHRIFDVKDAADRLG